jgi:hypothetical protein
MAGNSSTWCFWKTNPRELIYSFSLLLEKTVHSLSAMNLKRHQRAKKYMVSHRKILQERLWNMSTSAALTTLSWMN